MNIDIENLKIVHYPDPVLRQLCVPIEQIDDNIVALAHKMIKLMKDANGAGLAAPQVGVPIRMFLADEENGPIDNTRVYINPIITPMIQETSPFDEGCLSIPKIFTPVLRPAHVKISATMLDGSTYEAESDGHMARVWQHENDHLDGTLILDRMRLIDKLHHKKRIKAMEDKWAKDHPPAEEPKPRAKKTRRKKRR